MFKMSKTGVISLWEKVKVKVISLEYEIRNVSLEENTSLRNLSLPLKLILNKTLPSSGLSPLSSSF